MPWIEHRSLMLTARIPGRVVICSSMPVTSPGSALISWASTLAGTRATTGAEAVQLDFFVYAMSRLVAERTSSFFDAEKQNVRKRGDHARAAASDSQADLEGFEKLGAADASLLPGLPAPALPCPFPSPS